MKFEELCFNREAHIMNRREFIVTCTQVSLAGLITLGTPQLLYAKSPAQVEFKGNLLKGTEDGKILSSSDNGLTWNVLAKLGEHNQVYRLAQSRHHAFVKINHHGHHFVLKSLDGETWVSA